MAVKKICVLGLGKTGVPLSAVIAYKCPEIRVTVVKTNPEDIFQWNTGKMPQVVPGLEEVMRKCQNKNLVFTTNEGLAIKEAEIIFITSESKLKCRGEGANRAVDLSVVEDAAYLIAEHAESNKIVVENSCVPLRSAECVANVFKHNGKPGVEFQVLSNPEFYEQGSSLRNLLYPECVLIGSQNTAKGLAAAKQLASIYERWVPSDVIVTRTNWTTELSKIATSALAAQELASVLAMSCICEESNGDVGPLIDMLSMKEGFGYALSDVNFSVGKFPKVLDNLVYMCECIDLNEVADYWRQVLEMFTLHQERFFKKILWTLTHTWNKRMALLGFAYHKDTQVTEGSAAIGLCKLFVEENAIVGIYDPRVTKAQVIEDLQSAGCKASERTLSKSLAVFDDPYKAAYEAQVIVTCGAWPEFAELDFGRIFGGMMKPAYIFDSGRCLPHENLSKIGFKVYTVGKYLKN